MKPSTENEITGKVHEVKGKIKEKVGQLTNDPDLEGEGIGEKDSREGAEENRPVGKGLRKTLSRELLCTSKPRRPLAKRTRANHRFIIEIRSGND